MTHLLLAAVLAAAYPPAPVPPPEKAIGPAPTMLSASIENDKLFINRAELVPVQEERLEKFVEDNVVKTRKVVVNVYKVVQVTTAHDLSGVKAVDGAGKEVDTKTLGERLKKPTLVVVSADGQPVDARYLQLLKAETLVLVLPQPKQEKPGVDVPPDRIPPKPLPPDKIPGVKPDVPRNLPAVALAEEPKKDDEPKGKEVKYEVHEKGYFEKNNSGLKGDSSFLVLTDAKKFDEIFGVGRVMGPKPNFLPENAFETKVVIATIQRGNKLVTYKVDKVTADDDTLYLAYTTTTKDSPNATFNSPLIVSLDKGKYKSVVFIENGKKVGTAEFPK